MSSIAGSKLKDTGIRPQLCGALRGGVVGEGKLGNGYPLQAGKKEVSGKKEIDHFLVRGLS
jgi:hypothetical protein